MKKLLTLILVVSTICLTGCPGATDPGDDSPYVLVTLNFFIDDSAEDPDSLKPVKILFATDNYPENWDEGALIPKENSSGSYWTVSIPEASFKFYVTFDEYGTIASDELHLINKTTGTYTIYIKPDKTLYLAEGT